MVVGDPASSKFGMSTISVFCAFTGRSDWDERSANERSVRTRAAEDQQQRIVSVGAEQGREGAAKRDEEEDENDGGDEGPREGERSIPNQARLTGAPSAAIGVSRPVSVRFSLRRRPTLSTCFHT